MSISITKKTGTANTTACSGRSIKYIVVHYTAGTSSASGQAANTASYFSKSSSGASSDFIVDNANIVQYNPDVANRYCWHCGGSKQSTMGGSLYGTVTNKNSIGVEICSTNSTGTVKSANDSTWSFTSAALAKAKELIEYLMETYNIDADHVVRHYDCNGKLCPGIVGWNADSGSEAKWKAFLSGLSASSGMTNANCPFKVKVSISNLNIRKGAGTSYAKTGEYTGIGTFTITEVQSGTGSTAGWGKLKSGAGWISLDYCTLVS